MSKEELVKYQQVGRLVEEKNKKLEIMMSEIKIMVKDAISTPDRDHIYYRVEDNANIFLSNGENITMDLLERTRVMYPNCQVLKMEYSKYMIVCWA
jgi:spore germination protein GerM